MGVVAIGALSGCVRGDATYTHLSIDTQVPGFASGAHPVPSCPRGIYHKATHCECNRFQAAIDGVVHVCAFLYTASRAAMLGRRAG